MSPKSRGPCRSLTRETLSYANIRYLNAYRDGQGTLFRHAPIAREISSLEGFTNGIDLD